MGTPRKLSHPQSEVTRLKKLWRGTWPEAERDYWREQFESDLPRSKLRQELEDKYDVKLQYDTQLRRFCRWMEEEDLRKWKVEKAEADRAELEAQGLTGQKLRDELLRRMKEGALAEGNYKLGAEAVKLDVKLEWVSIGRRRLELQERKIGALEKTAEKTKRPGGLTPEVLAKIERELKLF